MALGRRIDSTPHEVPPMPAWWPAHWRSKRLNQTWMSWTYRLPNGVELCRPSPEVVERRIALEWKHHCDQERWRDERERAAAGGQAADRMPDEL